MAEVVISGAKPDLAKTEADAADGNEHGQEHRAAPGGEAARKPRSRRVKHVLPEPAGCKDDEHDKVKAAQSKQCRQQAVQRRLIIGKRTEQHGKRSQQRTQQDDPPRPESVGNRTEQRLKRCSAHGDDRGDPSGFGDIQTGQCLVDRPDAHAHEINHNMRDHHGDKRADRRIDSHHSNSLIRNKKTAWDIHGGLKSGDLDDEL